MAELQAPNRAFLRQTPGSDDDIESQPSMMTLATRRSGSPRVPAQWFQELYSRRIFKLAQPILRQSMYAVITGAVTRDLRLLPTSAIEPRPCATSSPYTDLPNSHADAQDLHGIHQIREYFDETGETEPVQPKRRRRSTSSDSRAKHNKRKEDIEKFLDPLLPLQDSPRDSFILICWGKHDMCHIKSIFLQDTDDDVVMWKAVQRAWLASRSTLKGHLKWFRRITNLEVVDVLIAGKSEIQSKKTPDEALAGGRFSSIDYIGVFSKDDTALEIADAQDVVDNYVPREWPCEYNFARGSIKCSPDCVSLDWADLPCPDTEVFKAKRKLLRLKMSAFQRMAFMNPDIATVNSVVDRRDTMYSRKDLRKRLNEWHCPSLGEIPFRAIYIEEDWIFFDFTVTLALATAMLLFLTLVCKFVYGDWAIAWNVGCFFATLAVALIQKLENAR